MESNDLDELKNLKDLRELVEFLKANEVAEFDLEKDDLKVRLKFASAAPPPAAAAPALDMLQLARMIGSAQSSGPVPSAPIALSAAEAPAAEAPKHHVVKSPIVGTFYDAPSPGSPPFVKVGDTVEVGQILCIVEAMKLMNEIESDKAGVVMERIAATGQPVEYGQALFTIKAN